MRRFFLAAVAVAIAMTAGCGPTRPAPESGPAAQPTAPASVYNVKRPPLSFEPQDLDEAKRVEYVGLRMAGQKNLVSAPLWADRDPEAVAHILAVLRTAELAANPQGEPQGTEPADWHLVVHYVDGTERWVTQARQRNPQGGSHWGSPFNYWVSGKGEVRSDPLDTLMRSDVRFSFLPPISPLEVTPRETTGGGEITITGRGWVGGRTARIRLADGALPLGEAPVERGEFRWTGKLPEKLTVPPWLHVSLRVSVDGVGEGATSVKVDMSKGRKK